MLLLALSVLAWNLVHQSQSVSAPTVVHDSSGGWLCLLPALLLALTLTPITLSTTIDFTLGSMGYSKPPNADAESPTSTHMIGTSVQWQGVSVHVGPSCVNLLMFQGAAAIGWLAARKRTLPELSRTIGFLIGFAGGLNFFAYPNTDSPSAFSTKTKTLGFSFMMAYRWWLRCS